MGKNPSNFQGKNLPVEKVSWHEAKKFCEKLGMKTGKSFRLPSESEWEYACRANTITPFYFGETLDAELANYRAQHCEAFGHVQSGIYGQGKLGVFRAKLLLLAVFLLMILAYMICMAMFGNGVKIFGKTAISGHLLMVQRRSRVSTISEYGEVDHGL